jgi:hypothetical protein
MPSNVRLSSSAVLRCASLEAVSQLNISTNRAPKSRAKSTMEIKRLSNGNYDDPEQFEIIPSQENLEKTGRRTQRCRI